MVRSSVCGLLICSLATVSLPASASARTSVYNTEPAPDPSWEEPHEADVPPELETPSEVESSPEAELSPELETPAETEMSPETEALLRDEDSPPAVSGAVPPPTPAQDPVPPPMPARPDTRNGLGLIITAAITGTLAIGTAVGRMAAIGTCVDQDAIFESEDYNLQTCIRSSRALLALTIPGWLLNAATWGLASGAGVVRGRHDGIRYAWDGRPKRVSGAYIGAGAGVLGVGLIGWVANRATFSRVIATDSIDGFRDNMIGYFGLLQLTSSMIAVGGGLMAYGIAYRQSRRRYAGQLGRQVRIVPEVGRRFTGLSLTGRF